MKLVYPLVEYWKQGDVLHAHVGKCARICYRADERNDKKLTEALWKNNHRSMFRHWSRYFVFPHYTLMDSVKNLFLENNPFIKYYDDGNDIYLSTNEQWIREHEDFYNIVSKYEVTEDRMFKLAKEQPAIYYIIRYTFKCITQISTSREFNRVSPNNIAEQSTRYVYDNGIICKPHWLSDKDVEIFNSEPDNGVYNNDLNVISFVYLLQIQISFDRYNFLIEQGLNKQDARGVLPLDTATVVAYTYSGSEWSHILDMRLRETTGAAHPNAKILAGLISDKLIQITNGTIM